jgi:hypothetical protein
MAEVIESGGRNPLEPDVRFVTMRAGFSVQSENLRQIKKVIRNLKMRLGQHASRQPSLRSGRASLVKRTLD